MSEEVKEKHKLSLIWSNIQANKRNYYCLKRAFGKPYKAANVEEKIAYLESVSDVDVKLWENEMLFFLCTAMCAQDSVYGNTYISDYLSDIYNASYATESAKKRVRVLISTPKRDIPALLKRLTEVMKRGIKAEGITFQLFSLYEDLEHWGEPVQLKWTRNVLRQKEKN